MLIHKYEHWVNRERTVIYSHFLRRRSWIWMFCLWGQSSNALGKQWALFRKFSRASLLPLFFWHLHIKQRSSWSNPLLCQSSCSLLWPGSIVKQLVFISVGERRDSVSSPLPLQMCLDQGKLTMCFVFFKTLMWLCHIFSADSHCY